jgi:hypothetical protein
MKIADLCARRHLTIAGIRLGVAQVLWMLLLVCDAGVAAAAGSALTAAEISAEIDASGAKAVVNRLTKGHVDAMGQNDWSRTMDEIWNGRLAFIALAPKLARGTEAGTAEDLTVALARALPVAPAAVLRVIDRRDGPVLGVSRVCGVPFTTPASKDVSGYLRTAQSAVGDVDTPRLQRIKAACLHELAWAANQTGARQRN